MQIHHASPGISVADKTSVQLLKTNNTPSGLLDKLNDAISHKAPYHFLFIADYAPSDRREKYRYVQELQKGLCRPCVLCTCSIGGPVGNYLFVWPLPEHVTLEASLCENQKVISQIQADVPQYHHRALKKKLISNDPCRVRYILSVLFRLFVIRTHSQTPVSVVCCIMHVCVSVC